VSAQFNANDPDGYHPCENAFIRESQPLVEIVHVFGEVDVFWVDELQKVIDEAARGVATVIVDLAPCSYIDSSTLSMLVRLSQTYAGRFRIAVKPSGLVHRVLAITALLKYLPIISYGV